MGHSLSKRNILRRRDRGSASGTRYYGASRRPTTAWGRSCWKTVARLKLLRRKRGPEITGTLRTERYDGVVVGGVIIACVDTDSGLVVVIWIRRPDFVLLQGCIAFIRLSYLKWISGREESFKARQTPNNHSNRRFNNRPDITPDRAVP